MRSLLLVLFLTLLTATKATTLGQTFETLFDHDNGVEPTAALVEGSDGNLYGTTPRGGLRDGGTVFKVTPTGVLTTLASFDGMNGSNPAAGLVQGSDGDFYGTTYRGGTSNKGTVFKVTPSGAIITLVSFDGANGSDPTAGLVQGSDGDFYGTTYSGGASNKGTAFRMTPSGVLTTLVLFDGANGSNPSAELVQGTDGNFYGTTSRGGPSDYGTTFSVTPSGVLITTHSFDSTNGVYPTSALTLTRDGNFYGTTSRGGSSGTGGYGTVFKLTPAGVLTRIYTFSQYDGSNGSGGLIEGSNGNLYGMTISPGSGGYEFINLFKLTPEGVFTKFYTWTRRNLLLTGYAAATGLLEGSDGSLYGVTNRGGASDRGTVFKVPPAGAITTLASFDPNNAFDATHAIYGADFHPRPGLVEGSDGNFYGATYRGGAKNTGTIFKVTRTGTHTTLVSFDGANGMYPAKRLVEGSDGNFYGTTETGTSEYGTVFKMTPAGVLTTLVSFNRTNGSYPAGELFEGSDGNFYGTTSRGGVSDNGTIFKMTPAGVLTTLISFDSTNGKYPAGGLVEGSDGNFYGMTSQGGISNNGTIFKMTPAGVLTPLISFDSTTGKYPIGRLVEGSDGNFYGATSQGGPTDQGTIFKLTPAGVLTRFVSFNSTNGRNPTGELVESSTGNFYGTTLGGGVSDLGTIFELTPAGVLTTLHSFDGVVASNPRSAPTFGSDGKLYGTALQLAAWRLSISSIPEVSTILPSAITSNGATFSGTLNAHGADTTVTFEYGLTPALGRSTSVTPGTVTGRSATTVSATLTGLAPGTTYYYRITASNSEGSVSTTAETFTTAENSLPTATNDSFVPALNDVGAITLPVLGNDSDADGDLLTITGVTQGSSGVVSTNGTTLTYTPRPGFLGRDSFSYTISDGFDTATAQVELQATSPFSRELFSIGSEVPGAGQEGSGIPAGSLFKSFGVPSMNSVGTLAFSASYAAPGNTSELSVLIFEPEAVKSTLAAQRGQAAPGTAGALFSSFKDPLLNEAGDIAFLATLSGGDTTKRNREGIWISSFSEVSGLGTELVARTGTQPPGTATGVRWKRFTSVAFSSSSSNAGMGAEFEEASWTLAFTGFMATGQGGVKSSNDMGLWIASPERTVLALREGQELSIGGTEKKVRTFAALKTLPGAAGQGNGITNTGGVAVQVFFTDGSQAMLRVSDTGEGSDIAIEVLALPGDAVADASETAAKFDSPAQSSSGAATAWLGRMSGKVAPAAIFERNLSTPELLQLMARKGDADTGIEGATFSIFSSVAVSDSGSALFLARVEGSGITKNNDEGLWWRKTSGSNTSLQLLVREGAQPPGTPQGVKWSAFTSLALPEGQYGPLFTARLLVDSKGKAAPGGTTRGSDQGLWAVGSSGDLHLVVREGQDVNVGSANTRKTLQRFTVLSAVPGSPAQRRSFDGQGKIVYLAFFTDGSQAIIKVQLP